MSQNRQPKGKESGGQFAATVNPESTVDLGAEKAESLTEVERAELGMRPASPTIANLDPYIKRLETDITELEESLQTASLDDAVDDISDLEESLLSSNRELVNAQSQLIEAIRQNREENPSLNEIVFIRASDRLAEQGSCTQCGLTEDDCPCDDKPAINASEKGDLDLVELRAAFDRYSAVQGHGPDFDGAFDGIDEVVEIFLDFWAAEKAKGV